MISKSKTIAQQRIIMFDRNMRFFNDMSSPRLYFLYFYHSADICRCTDTIRHRLLYFTVPEIWRRLFAHILQNDNDCSRHHRTWHNPDHHRWCHWNYFKQRRQQCQCQKCSGRHSHTNKHTQYTPWKTAFHHCRHRNQNKQQIHDSPALYRWKRRK